MASAVLGLIMLAVATSIGTAQKLAFESQKRLLASIAADDLLSEVATLTYDDLPALDGRKTTVGSMATLDGEMYPETFWPLGRRVVVTPQTISVGVGGGAVDGLMVRVDCYDEWAVLASYELFVPDPEADAGRTVASR